MQDQGVLEPGRGRTVWLGRLGVRFMVDGRQTDGRFALVEHPLPPGALAGPPHVHAHEDEITYVLEGGVTVQLGDRVLQAGPGSLLFKPRGVPHTFWNAGPAPLRLLELITPAGFERYFQEAAACFSPERGPDIPRLLAAAERYGLTLQMERLAPLMEQYGLTV